MEDGADNSNRNVMNSFLDQSSYIDCCISKVKDTLSSRDQLSFGTVFIYTGCQEIIVRMDAFVKSFSSE